MSNLGTSGWIPSSFLKDEVGPGVRVTKTVSGVISPYSVVKLDNGSVAKAEVGETEIFGVAITADEKVTGETVTVACSGVAKAKLDLPVNKNDKVKVYRDGKVGPVLESANLNRLLANALAIDSQYNGAFTNQPANDGVEVVSSSALDTTSIVVYGTTHGSTDIVKETLVLNGTTPVSSVKTDWGAILAFEIPYGFPAGVGTITLREASGNLTIKTLAPEVRQAGVYNIPLADQATYHSYLRIQDALNANTSYIGILGTDIDGNEQLDCIQMNGTTFVTNNLKFRTVSKILIGDLDSPLHTIAVFGWNLEEDLAQTVGLALEDGKADEVIDILIQPHVLKGAIGIEQLSSSAETTRFTSLPQTLCTELFSTPQVVVPAPGPGKAIVFLGAHVHYNTAGNAFTLGSNTALEFRYTNGSGQLLGTVASVGFLDQTSDQYRWIQPEAGGKILNQNQPVVIYTNVTNISGGISNSLLIKVYYRIVDVDLS